MVTNTKFEHPNVGEIRPSQLLYTFGIGSVVDLPNISVMVMGLDDWPFDHLQPIEEERLLAAVQRQPGLQNVQTLRLPPISPDTEGLPSPFDESSLIGVPVSPFPRWMRCPYCNLLSPIPSPLFELKSDPYYPERTKYVHVNCRRPGKPPTVLPARFLVACENGHIDDFPWLYYVHGGPSPCRGPLQLREIGVSGAASDILIECEGCDTSRSMAQAFEKNQGSNFPACRGRHPHIRHSSEKQCMASVQPITLGASNNWFPSTITVLSIPSGKGDLSQIVEQYWSDLSTITSKEFLQSIRQMPMFKIKCRELIGYSDDDLWAEIQKRKQPIHLQETDTVPDLKTPEWEVFSNPDPSFNSKLLRLRAIDPPETYKRFLKKVVLVERLREVGALIGFTRIESSDALSDLQNQDLSRRVPLSRKPPAWLPVSVIRGEGIFLQFNEDTLQAWEQEKTSQERESEFFGAHCGWRTSRNLAPDVGFPGIRYILLHSFSHALMRQFALECGYTAASIRERIYSSKPGGNTDSMAGVLIYTAAADSEGTLGGLVSLGKPHNLGRHIAQALEQIRICTSDPLCAEHRPTRQGVTLHGASCHACLFSPETSCEKGNRYLDRALLVRTFGSEILPFFKME